MNKKASTPSHEISRRNFMNRAALGAGALALGASSTQAAAPKSDSMGPTLKFSGYELKHLQPLFDGRVKVEGCDAQFEAGAIGDMNTDVFSGAQTRDVTEIGLHPYMLAYANEGFRDYALLPIFPLRLFRHKSVFIRNDRGIEKPEDLKGKRVGTAGFSSTSLTWIRGIFQDEYGIAPEDMSWVVSQKDSSAKAAGKVSAQENVFPEGLDVEMGPPGLDESDLLASGAVDVVFHAAEPRAYQEGHPKIARLFPNSKATERAYYEKTGVFPIMHAVAIKRSVLKQYPWLAKAVFEAYSKSKDVAYQQMTKLGWIYEMLPWYGQELESTKELMGDDFYKYGIEPNRKALETLFRYSYEQKLASKHLTVEELFAPESLSL